MYPMEQHFSRQQVVEFVGVSDDMIGYWMRNGLLRSLTTGSPNARKHRRFDFVQLNIAALLNELRRYGTSIEALGSFAAMVQDAAALGHALFGYDLRLLWDTWEFAEIRQLDFDGLRERLVTTLPEEPEIQHPNIDAWAQYLAEKRPSSFSWAAFELSKDPRLTCEALARLPLYRDLIDPDHFSRYSDWFWHLARDSGGNWIIAGSDADSGPGSEMKEQPSYIAMNVSKLVRAIWAA